MTAESLIELVARAIHTARGHNPDTLHQHIDFGDGNPQYPNDKTEQYAAFNEPKTRHLHYGWRHDVKTAKAAIEAYEAAKPSEISGIERGTIEHLVKREIPVLALAIAETDWPSYRPAQKFRQGCPTHSDGLANIEWEKEVEHRVRIAKIVLSHVVGRCPEMFQMKDVPWYVATDDEVPR
jgi:hypothetical protein